MKLITMIVMTTIIKTATLEISSPAFSNKGSIPMKYTCEGDEINPPISVKNIPAGTKSLTLIVDDPDAPKGTFDHWVIWNIKPTELISENSAPGIQGKNGAGAAHYKGPCPPQGEHRYFFKIYALDINLELKEGADKKAVEDAMKDHILAKGELIGMYKKVK
jgi:Raf kinase inhibitor-like YbhB/YbcL family protein